MNATELRIGNLVNVIERNAEVHLPGSTVYKVQEIGFDCLLCEIDKNPLTQTTLPVFAARNLSPISLTEDWLLKFGFQIHENGHSIIAGFGSNPVTNYDYLVMIKKYTGMDEEDIWFYRNKYHKLHYVHQLQNLFFALTKKELKIKEQ